MQGYLRERLATQGLNSGGPKAARGAGCRGSVRDGVMGFPREHRAAEALEAEGLKPLEVRDSG